MLNWFLCIGGLNFRISACRFLITGFLYAGFCCILEPLPVSASIGFLIRGLKRLNFSLKVLMKIGSFMWVSTVKIKWT